MKPQNVIISETDNKVKLIDMGAAADLRVGINYVPNEFLLDPRYAPPQQYIMSTQVSLQLGGCSCLLLRLTPVLEQHHVIFFPIDMGKAVNMFSQSRIHVGINMLARLQMFAPIFLSVVCHEHALVSWE